MIDDPLSLLSLGIWLMAAGMWPVGFLFGACSACCDDGPCVCGNRDGNLGEKAMCIWCAPNTAPNEITIRVTAQTPQLSFERQGFGQTKLVLDIDCSSADGDYVLQRGTGITGVSPDCNTYTFSTGCGSGRILVWCSAANKGEFIRTTPGTGTILQSCVDNGKYEAYGSFRFATEGTITPVLDGNTCPELGFAALCEPMDIEAVISTWYEPFADLFFGGARLGGWPFTGEFDSSSCNLADLPVPASNFNTWPAGIYIGPNPGPYFDSEDVEGENTPCFGLEDYALIPDVCAGFGNLSHCPEDFGYENVPADGGGFKYVGYLSTDGCVMQIEIVNPV